MSWLVTHTHDSMTKIKHTFNNDKKISGSNWFNGFLSRNPDLSMRIPESTSMSRIIGFWRSEVNSSLRIWPRLWLLEWTLGIYVFIVDVVKNVFQRRSSELLPLDGMKVRTTVQYGRTSSPCMCKRYYSLDALHCVPKITPGLTSCNLAKT